MRLSCEVTTQHQRSGTRTGVVAVITLAASHFVETRFLVKASRGRIILADLKKYRSYANTCNTAQMQAE
jgi:hypothetical protein